MMVTGLVLRVVPLLCGDKRRAGAIKNRGRGLRRLLFFG